MNWDSHRTRREFVRCGARAFGAFSVASTLRDLARVGAATASGDYRALVCVFLSGGNDANNMLVPRDGDGDRPSYVRARGSLALPSGALRPIAPLRSTDRRFGLHPAIAPLGSLFDQRKIAIVANIGPLVAPVTKSEYESGSVPTPPQLFSHSDQVTHWQTAAPDRPALTGWGGRTADLLGAGAPLPIAFSLAGSNTFQTGESMVPYSVSTEGVNGLYGYDPARPDARTRGVTRILDLAPSSVFEREFRDVTKRALAANAQIRTALSNVRVDTPFPDTEPGKQLGMAARLIAARVPLGQSRQILFCSIGGFDTHEGQLAAQVSLLTELAGALTAFHAATVELGVSRSVVTFTASDFGRALVSNGGGSDHGWGGHHFVLGDSVRGGDLYGRFPSLALDGPDDGGDGRWIPTTSVDEYAATIARWFGLSPEQLRTVFPNLRRFDHPDMGFLS